MLKAIHILAAGLVVLSAPAFAHPKLVTTSPAADETVSNVSRASLGFSETLLAPVSGIDLVMTGMEGMAHDPMKITGIKTALGADGKTLVAAFPRALAAGNYRLDWHVVSTDTHGAKGSYSFTVR